MAGSLDTRSLIWRMSGKPSAEMRHVQRGSGAGCFAQDAAAGGATAKGKAELVRVEKAFTAIISKTRFRRVNRLMRSCALKVAKARRVGSSLVLRVVAILQG